MKRSQVVCVPYLAYTAFGSDYHPPQQMVHQHVICFVDDKIFSAQESVQSSLSVPSLAMLGQLGAIVDWQPCKQDLLCLKQLLISWSRIQPVCIWPTAKSLLHYHSTLHSNE